MSIENVSRRLLLSGSALFGFGALAQACSDDNPSTPTDAGVDAGTDAGRVAEDLVNLNGLLRAEYGAIKAYDAGAGILMAPPSGDPQASMAPVVLAIAVRWQQQHRDHAAQLVAAINSAGGTPVAESAVTFTAPSGFSASVANVLKLACNAEKAAAVAYNRAVGLMSEPGRRFLATTIEGDETQHFIVLYLLLKSAVTPAAGLVDGIPRIVPVSFVSNIGGANNGLQSVADLTFA